MHRIDGPGAINGEFSEGNPATGQRATKVTSTWLNDVQAQFFGVFTEVGHVPVKGRGTDLMLAIKTLVTGMIGTPGDPDEPEAPAGVPTGRQITASGLAVGGGTLAADRDIFVPKASAAEVAAGLVDDKAITPLALKNSVSAQLAASGYSRLPGGRMDQWGGVRGNYGEGAVYVPFPTPFPNACFRVMATVVNASSGNRVDMIAQIVSYDASGATIMLQQAGGETGRASGFDFFAIGH